MSRHPSDRKASFCDEFFKVYLPDQSSQRMRVPPAFVKLLNGDIPNKAILQDIGGKFWHVEMEEAEGGLYFMDGWQRFVSDHSLEFGNFLVFTYNGDSSFDVKIFGNNGCMKEESLGNQSIIEGPSTVEKTNITGKMEKESEEAQTYHKPVHNLKRKYTEVAVKRSEKAKVPGSSEESWRKSPRIASKSIQQLRPFDISEFSLPKNPYFIASVCLSAPIRVNVPRKFLAEYGIKMEPEMLLRDDNGKLWPINVCYSSDGRVIIGKGWSYFLECNKLGFRDQCAFEFVFRRGGRLCREILVHIFRANGK